MTQPDQCGAVINRFVRFSFDELCSLQQGLVKLRRKHTTDELRMIKEISDEITRRES